jgi:hypothetical protein
VHEIQKREGTLTSFITEKVEKGHLGASTSKGVYDYEGRSEEEILRIKRRALPQDLAPSGEHQSLFDPV